MSALTVSSPYKLFTDVDGNPLESGYIYIGTAGLNAEASPISTYWDAALTIPASQPIRTIGGSASRGGSAANIYVDASDYSIIVKNKNMTLVYSSLNNNIPGVEDIQQFTSKADAVAWMDSYGIVDGQQFFITSDDGGSFAGKTGAAAGTYSDNSALACGTQFTPTGGDGSSGLLRDGNTVLNPLMFGAAGDIKTGGSTDDVVALQEAIDWASTDGSVIPFESNPTVYIDLLGRGYGLGSSPDYDGKSNVTLINGGLKAVGGAWTGSDFMLDLTHTGVYEEAANNKFTDINVDCANLTSGFYLEWTKRYHIDGCNIVRFTAYGVRTSEGAGGTTRNGEFKLTNSIITQGLETEAWLGFEIETQTGETNGRGVGVSQRTADFMHHNNVVFKCRVCAEYDAMQNGQVTANHFFSSNRTANNDGMAVSAIADNGSGLIRVTTATSHYSETDDVINIDEVVGTTEANSWWKVTKISDTVVDLQNSTFTNAYTSGGVFRPFNYTMTVGALSTNTTVGIVFDGNYFDAEPVIFWNSFDHIFTSNLGLAGNTDWTLKIFILATATSEDGGGMIIADNMVKNDIELRTAEHGTWSATPTIQFAHNKTNVGGLAKLDNPSAIANWVYLNNGIAIASNGTLSFDVDGSTNIGNTNRMVGNVWANKFRTTSGNVFHSSGTGSPEGVLVAGVGSTYTDIAGGAGTTFYVKESGTGNLGWVAK